LARIVLVTPALAAANNGNWQTAARWARMLAGPHRVDVRTTWQGEEADLMLALHARRSAASVAAWAARRPGAPLVVVLTGTDLYRDIQVDDDARRSIAAAHRLVVLNDHGAASVPAEHRHKVVVCLQSARGRMSLADKPSRWLRAVVVGHLRDEKAPETVFAAARQLGLTGRSDIRIDHIGGPLDPQLGAEAARLMAEQPTYRWLGDRPHGEVRRRIQQAHVLVHPSRMEGGAHVVIEAIVSGTPVLASAIDGNLGLLGDDWPATFAVDDAKALAALVERSRDDPGWLASLRARAEVRAPRFSPDAECATLRALVARTLAEHGCSP
jgi:putative glycosyltransferase (TIGR04348 family)